MYRLYLELRSVDAVKEELARRGLRATNSPFSRGHLYRLLENPIYIGRIRHKATIYKGQHPALIDRPLWDQVQALLAQNRAGQPHRSRSKNPSLFAGLLFDHKGRRLLSTHAVKRGVRYRYYVSPDRLKRQADAPSPDAAPGLRLATAEVEDAILALLKRLLRDRDWLLGAVIPPQASLDLQQTILRRADHLAERLASDNPVTRRDAVLTLLQRVDLRDDEVQLTLQPQALGHATTPIAVARPLALRRRGVETKLIIEGEGPADPQPDPAMVRALAQAHRWWRDLLDKRYPTMKEIAQAYRTDERYVARIIPLAFLPAQLTRDILNGTQPPEMTLVELMAGEGA
ncbi:recombinase family protein [Ancylobacter sp. Lp-2]|uniref:recombinase family protein n=1 Tax=Ancylobacter sp. Lp-2 TaxID=2881339 RepID=UPI00351D1B0B|nr:recombinase family protein [Ancylobacter sp. Lp-2]